MEVKEIQNIIEILAQESNSKNIFFWFYSRN